ncbi:MAG: carboxypeptidase-like regulatory domain-containing protein [Planctomycetota bacterium]|nr:carboxypeptidase-like regulatory domain-containing protein [Planctomycetota bacterium]
MKRISRNICFAWGLATLLWVTGGSSAEAKENPPVSEFNQPSSTVLDIAISDNATLTGRLTAPDGTPLANRSVRLSSGTKVLQTTISNAAGYYIFFDVPSGSLAITSGDQFQHLRVWQRKTAPPIAKHEANLVCGPTVRGQFGSTIGGFTAPSIHPVRYLQHPATVFGVIGLAIAAPLAIHEETAKVPIDTFYSPSLSTTSAPAQ